MNSKPQRLSWLAVLALAALATYWLACTSFSPDDTKILYPAFDVQGGDVAVALYNRVTHENDLVFVPSRPKGLREPEREIVLLRPQWLPDGRRMVAVWPGYSDNDDDVLNVAVLPGSGKGPVRLFALPGIDEAKSRLLLPQTIASHYLFISADSNALTRVDLDTGGLSTHHLPGKSVALMASPSGNAVLYFAEEATRADTYDVGRLNPETFAQTQLLQIRREEMAEEGAIAVSADGQRLAMIRAQPHRALLRVWRGDQVQETVPLDFNKETVHFGSLSFSIRAEVLYAAYASQADGKKTVTFGLMEIPLGEGTPRRIPLFIAEEASDKESALFFQMEVSHDGKTAAGCSTYLAVQGEIKLKPEDCALYMIDLVAPERTATKVVIPLPKKLGKLGAE